MGFPVNLAVTGLSASSKVYDGEGQRRDVRLQRRRRRELVVASVGAGQGVQRLDQ